jgi:biotin operon repressor
MPTYSTEFKDNVVRKMMPPNSQSIEQVGQELGLSRSTLYAWKQQYRAKGHLVPATPSNPDQWDTKSKFTAINTSLVFAPLMYGGQNFKMFWVFIRVGSIFSADHFFMKLFAGSNAYEV